MYGSQSGLANTKCARDLEGDAKRLKKRIDVNNALIDALEQFAHDDGIYQIEDHGDRKTLFAIYGDLKMRQPGMAQEYDRLLEMIEKKG